MPTPISEFSVPNRAAFDRSTSRTYTDSSAPKQRTANMPAVIARITNEMAACVKMKRNPWPMEDSTELAAAAADGTR